MSNDAVLGLDGGGSRTRVIVAAPDGYVLGAAEQGGASIEFNDPDVARQNLQSGVRAALADADRVLDDVRAGTAGIGGLAGPREHAEAKRALDLDGLSCEIRVVSDAVVAHTGAFRGAPGIVAIGGTGSLVFGRMADGEQIRNYEYFHYAEAGAHNLGERALQMILAGEVPADWSLTERLLDRWECASVAELRVAVRKEDRFTNVPSGNPLDSVAPMITAVAADGDAYAQVICEDAVLEVVTGIRIVGGALADPVRVAAIGSVLRSEYMTAEFRDQVAALNGYQYVEPAMSPVAGATFDAIDRVFDGDAEVRDRLTAHPMGCA